MAAQQQKTVQRSSIPLAFPEFMDAKVLQPFGRSVKARANIFLKNSALLFVQDGQVMQANIDRVLGVEFDSIKYMKVSSEQMGRVVAQKGYNRLLCCTHVNMPLYREETTGGKGMDNFTVELPGSETFLNLDTQKRDDEGGIPLTDTYYFYINGFVIPANESSFKKFVGKDQMQAFKVLKENRFWSWNDPESLKMLLDFLPEK